MAEQQKVDFRIEARKRWPQASPVTGVGPYAVISRCSVIPAVRLFETSKEAFDAAKGKCEHAFCKKTHDWTKLEIPAAGVSQKSTLEQGRSDR